MLAKRIIPCLDVKEGRTVKGINFVDLKDAGDPVELAYIYAKEGADELVFLDISATQEKRKTLADLVRSVAKVIDIPFTVGGGIASMEDVSAMLHNGADKISINSFAVKHPKEITTFAREFGSQCITVAIDTRYIQGKHIVHTHGGTIPTVLDTLDWAKQVEELGAGEILLTSMDHDGVKNGFANELLAQIAASSNIPIVASGGAGKMEHFKDVFALGKSDAALAASIFHFKEISIGDLKRYLKSEGIAVREVIV